MKKQLLKCFLSAIVILIAIGGFTQTPDIRLQAKNENVQAGTVLDFTLLFGQTANPVSFGIASQQFPDFPAYSCQAADDFVVPDGETWTVENMQINGFYGAGGGPVQVANVFFYLNNQLDNSPGNFVVVIPQMYAQTDPTGNLLFDFGNNPVQFQSGHYWLSVQPIMAYTNFGQWFWAKQAAPTILQEFYWQNPDEGWGLPNTTTWQKASLINWGSPSVDWNLSFALYGTNTIQPQPPFISTINDYETHVGESVRLYGSSFGEANPASILLVDGIYIPVTYWSDNEVYFDCPMFDVSYPHYLQLNRADGILSNQITFTVYQPTGVFFLSPNEDERIIENHLQIKVALPVFRENITEVQFYYQPIGSALWSYLGSDFDGTDLTYGTNNPIGTGDGWSYDWNFNLIADMTYVIKSIAFDIYGNTYTGFRNVTIDYNPPGLLIYPDSSKLVAGKTVPEDYFDIVAEVDENETIEINISIKDLIGFTFTRALKHVYQDTVIVRDKNGVNISGSSCGPVAAAVCLDWMKQTPAGTDLTDLINELAEKAGTDGEGTQDDNLEKAMNGVAGKHPGAPDAVKTERWAGGSNGYNVVGKELRDSSDVILLIQQPYIEVIGGVPIIGTTGHYVTVSSHHVYYGYEPGPEGSGIMCMAVERQYIDFMDPGTGETEYKEVEYWKTPPVIKDYSLVLPPKVGGDATIERTIVVKKPPEKKPNRYGEVVYTATIPTNGQGIYHLTIPCADLPTGVLLAEIHTNGSKAELASDFVILTNGDATPFASFSAANTTGAAPFTVQFSDLSLPPDSIKSWQWDFGDDEQSTTEEPQHTYLETGLYDVILIVSDGNTSDTLLKSDYIEVTVPVCQSIGLPAGWSGMSSFIESSNPDITTMFAPVADDLIILYNFSTLFFPAGGILPDEPWDSQSGYVVKMINDAPLSFCGTIISTKVVSLKAGWNIMPVLSQENVDVALTFGSIEPVKVAKDIGDVGVYWKAYGVNSLEWMLPGKAYFVYTTEDVDVLLHGIPEGMKSIPDQESGMTTPWNKIIQTAESHVIVFPSTAGTAFRLGDIIGAFDALGSCCGTMEYSGNSAGLVGFGDDPYSENADGFENNELFIFRLYRPETGEQFNLNVKYESTAPSSGNFETNGLSVVKSADLILLNSGKDDSYIDFELLPNPAKEKTTIKTNALDALIEIINIEGVTVYSAKLTGSAINLSGLKPGVYFVRLHNEKEVIVKKLVIR